MWHSLIIFTGPGEQRVAGEPFLRAEPQMGVQDLVGQSVAFADQLETALEGGRALLAAWPLLLAALVIVGGTLLAVAAYRRYRRRRKDERFSSFFEAAPGPLLLLNGERRVLEANQAACELMGRPLSALQGRRFDDFLESVGTESPRTAFETVEMPKEERSEASDSSSPSPSEGTASGASAQAEARIERPDGTARQVRLRLRALHIGERRCMAATLQDMTSVSEEHSFFKYFHRRTVQGLPIEMAVLNPEGTYLYVNPEASTDNISPQWLKGKTDFDLCRRLGLHPEVALRRRSHRRRALQRGERVQFEEVLSRRDAPPRHVERFYTPIFAQEDGEQEAHAVVTYALDRTQLKKREEALDKAQRESEDYEEMKATLLRNLRHEFRSPLTSILGAAEVLREDLPEDQRDFIDILYLNGQRLLRTLNAMLDLAGTQLGSIDQRPRVLSMEEAVEDVIGEFQEMAQEKGLYLRKQALATDALVRVDPASLYRVLRSIIGNAVKFTEEGGVVVEIEDEAGRAEVRVIDTGVGIEEEYIPQLFDSFQQEDGSETRHFEGMGVGLSVARRLIDLMGGTISVDSKKGEGSIFTVTLPVAFRDTQGEPLRVLAVEGDEEQEKLLRHRLENQVQLVCARTQETALDAARRQRFAAVFVSAGLSSEDAAGDFVERLRSIDDYAHTPLIVIDESALPGAAEQFEAYGYDEYVARPLKREDLLNALGDALGGRSQQTPAVARENIEGMPDDIRLAERTPAQA